MKEIMLVGWQLTECLAAVQRAIALQSGDVAAQAFRRSAELGLSPGTIQVQCYLGRPIIVKTCAGRGATTPSQQHQRH